MSTTQKSYGERVLDSIHTQCARRGIPTEEAGSVLAHIAEAEGARVMEMGAGQLRRLSQNLDAHFVSYLDGAKRRAGPGSETWPNATPAALTSAAEAGIAIADVEGTGKDGQVTDSDVAKARKERDAEDDEG